MLWQFLSVYDMIPKRQNLFLYCFWIRNVDNIWGALRRTLDFLNALFFYSDFQTRCLKKA